MGKNRRRNRNRKKEATAAPLPPWTELPLEVTADILRRLGARNILSSAQKVCTTWRNVCKDPSMWRVIDLRNLHDYHDVDTYIEAICRQAVDRSEGQLTDIYIDYFATDELIQYISERSSQLKCLMLWGCDFLSAHGLREATKRFPLLEEAHLVFMRCYNEDIEPIGRSCPKLRSFTLGESQYKCPNFTYNDNAFAIAKSMPGLRQLRLLGNNMTNEGLEAILDGCPFLESLDIRKCYKVDLSGDLGKRITQKIKYLLGPDDPMEGCEWSTENFDFGKYMEHYDYNCNCYSCVYSSGYSDVDFIDDYDYNDYDDYDDFPLHGFEYRGDRDFDLYVPF